MEKREEIRRLQETLKQALLTRKDLYSQLKGVSQENTQWRAKSQSLFAKNPKKDGGEIHRGPTMNRAGSYLLASNHLLRNSSLNLLEEAKRSIVDLSDLSREERTEVDGVLSCHQELSYDLKSHLSHSISFSVAQNPSSVSSTPPSTSPSTSTHSSTQPTPIKKSDSILESSPSLQREWRICFSPVTPTTSSPSPSSDGLSDSSGSALDDMLEPRMEPSSPIDPLVDDISDALQGHDGLIPVDDKEDDEDGTEDFGFHFGDERTIDNSIYPFDEEDTSSNIMLDDAGAGNTRIKAATLHKLIEKLTHEKSPDLNTRYVFLLTYHSFTTPSELLRLLALRYNVPIPPNLSTSEIRTFKSTKVDRIQIRVCSVLKNWIDEHYSDFSEDPILKKELSTLIQNMLESSASVVSTQLSKALSSLMKKREKALHGVKGVIITSKEFPKPLLSSKVTAATFSFDACDELEIARQLTLMDWDKFKNIQPRECLNQAWNKKNKEEIAPNIVKMIDQFNKVSSWVQFTIINETNIQKRAVYWKKFAKIAERLRELNNFNSLFAIYCGMEANALHRMKRTKELVNKGVIKKFDEFKVLFDPDKNCRNFRRVLQTTLTPCIPHLGIFLQDLTFTEDGNPDEIHGMINFQKRAKLAERIRWIKQYQQEGYQLQFVPVIQEYFGKSLRIEDPETLWKKSCEVEPRQVRPT